MPDANPHYRPPLPGKFLIFLLLLFWLPAAAQKDIQNIRLTLDIVELPLSDAFSTISQQSGLPFSYNPKRIPVDQRITYRTTDKKFSEILFDLSEQLGLQFSIVESQVVVKPGKRKAKSETSSLTLSGYIKDKKSGEALIGASVSVATLNIGTTSNAFGFYALTLPKGEHEVSISYIGFRSTSLTIDLTTQVTQDILLDESPPVLTEVVVQANNNIIEEPQTGKVNLRPATIIDRPSFFGETDVVKSLESVPGVKFHSDGSTFYYVRGGNRDQNLMLVDDAPIYNPSHLLGLFSTVIPDAVNDITFYKGSMPASLGGRLSSTIDIRTRKGNDQHFQAWGSAGLISTKLGIEGPIQKDFSSYLVTARFSRLQWYFNLLDNNVNKFNFYDINGKFNIKLDHRNRLFITGYKGADNYFSENNGISWSNVAGSLKWNHIFGEKLFMNTTVAASAYDYFLHVDVANDTRWNSHISNVNLKTDFSYFINPASELTFGAGINGFYFNPGNIQSRSPINDIPTVSVRNSAEIVLYANHEILLGRHWALNYGLRVSSWTNAGEAFEFVFDQNKFPVDTLFYKSGQRYKTYTNAEPRVSLSFLFNEHSSLKASYARNVQNIHLLTNSISPFTSMEVWVPSSNNIQPQTSDQLSTGYYHTFDKTAINFSVEGFYKKLYHQIDYVDHAATLLNPLLESQLRFGTGTSCGIEFLMKRDIGRIRGLLGYTWSRAKKDFPDLNHGQQFNAFYDRPHQFSAMVAYDINLRWNLGANWTYSTGASFSSPVGYYTFNGLEIPLYGQRNNDRLPDYHRLDLSGTYRLNKNAEKKFQHSLTFSIFNAYGRKNALFINYHKKVVDDGSFRIPSNLTDVQRQPSMFYLFSFTPSVSYNFKWR